MKKKIVVTGGAGFIGSNLVEALLANEQVEKVRVIDNLANGYLANIEAFHSNPKFEFVNADVCDLEAMVELTKGFQLISHQAALGSVPRSIKDPKTTNDVNIGGSLNVLFAAVQNGIERVVLACSSSTYGDSKELPKVESKIGRPLSPYAITKYTMELYADIFKRNYGLDYIGLRYFNIFGPKQNPDNPYAAVIPLFCKAYLNDEQPVVNGDGNQSRDFTYVDNAVDANLRALFTNNAEALNEVYNVACGEQTSLNAMVAMLNEISGKELRPVYGPERTGDVRHSRADIAKARRLLDYEPKIFFKEGLATIYRWYEQVTA